MAEAMEAGTSPNEVALRIVGRIDDETGRRSGGIIGLTSREAGFVEKARAELESNDPAMMRQYLLRRTRDKRFDRSVKAAIRTGEPIDAGTITRAADRMSDKLLKLRGDRIARTELLGSLHEAQDEALRQMVDRGDLKPSQIRRRWDAADDKYTRDSHNALDDTVNGLDEPFVTIHGHSLMYPGDRSMGAPAEEIINCRCVLRIDVDYIAALGPGD